MSHDINTLSFSVFFLYFEVLLIHIFLEKMEPWSWVQMWLCQKSNFLVTFPNWIIKPNQCRIRYVIFLLIYSSNMTQFNSQKSLLILLLVCWYFLLSIVKTQTQPQLNSTKPNQSLFDLIWKWLDTTHPNHPTRQELYVRSREITGQTRLTMMMSQPNYIEVLLL